MTKSRYSSGYGLKKDYALFYGADYDASVARSGVSFCLTCKAAHLYEEYKNMLRYLPEYFLEQTH